MTQKELHVGIVGAGIGGLMASIAIASKGIKVQVLEAAEALGEIGAGIQMTPNVSRLLIKYGVDKAIGENLVRFREVNLRAKDGSKISYTSTARVERTLGFPWWLVHRHHLHSGLVEVAKGNGVDIRIGSRVVELREVGDGRVDVATQGGDRYTFDLVVGADGAQSMVRKTLFPGVKPTPPTGNCAYRAIVPYEEIRNDPATRGLVEDEDGRLVRTMEVWTAPTGYIIAYPISDGRDFNMVLSHFRDRAIDSVHEVRIEEVREQYKTYDARIRAVIEKIRPPVSRWPLLVTGPLSSWSNGAKNIVLMGDAAHSMTNHMAQGAATSMEDGVFLASCLQAVMDGRRAGATMADAVTVYETGRMGKASFKQQLSFLNGWIWHLADGPAQEARDRAMEADLSGEVQMRSPNLYGDPVSVLECYGYDAEAHAQDEIARWMNDGKTVRDGATTVTRSQADRTVNWFLPEGHEFAVKAKM